MGYDTNKERIEKIRELRTLGMTIDSIAKTTGWPRSSIGYYVKKYCIDIKPGQLRNRKMLTDIFDNSNINAKPVRYVIERTDSSQEDKYKEKGDFLAGLAIEKLFEKDPRSLYYKLQCISELNKLASYLRINMDEMRFNLIRNICQ